MKSYFVIITTAYKDGTVTIHSDNFPHYPTEKEIKEELFLLNEKGYDIYHAKVEKRYELIWI